MQRRDNEGFWALLVAIFSKDEISPEKAFYLLGYPRIRTQKESKCRNDFKRNVPKMYIKNRIEK